MMARTRIRSDIKWLLNQAAALAGEMERIDAGIAKLKQRRKTFEEPHAACLRSLCILFNEPLTDVVLPTVQVQRWYGGRGRLRRFIKGALKEVAPAPVGTDELLSKAVQHLNLTFVDTNDFRRFQDDSFTRALRTLAELGVIEAVGQRDGGFKRYGAWRWKSALPPLKQKLAAPASAMPLEKRSADGVDQD